MSKKRLYTEYVDKLKELETENLYRRLRSVNVYNPFADIDGKRVLLLCSNDYLGLSMEKDVRDALKKSIDLNPISQCSSRLVAGNDESLESLEHELARQKGVERVLVYPTGYMANFAISALVSKSDLILSDELNHASIVDACRLSGAKISIFKHNDIHDLEKKAKDEKRRKFIITEGVFSMDGDLAPLKNIADIAEKNNAMLILDDAHGDFIYGENFRGMSEYFNVRPDLIISSMSKALGCFGGYVAGSDELIEYLINKSRTFIYTSALPSFIASAAVEALKIVKKGSKQRILNDTVKRLREGLRDLGFEITSESHIIPIIIGKEERALQFSELLLANGVFAQAIRYPTVKRSSARIRISVTARHDKYIDNILEVFKRCKYIYNN